MDTTDPSASTQLQTGEGSTPAAAASQISTSFFPPPPQVYQKYTARNLHLLQVLQSHQLGSDEAPWHSLDPAQRMQRQEQVLRAYFQAARSRKRKRRLGGKGTGGTAEDGGVEAGAEADERMDLDGNGADAAEEEKEREEDELPDFDLKLELERPNVEWVEEDGGYTVFGQTWPIPEVTPTLEELGIPTLYPPDSADRKHLLTSLLQTLLHTYQLLTTDLLRPSQPYDTFVPTLPATAHDPTPPGIWTQSTEAKDHLAHLHHVVINMQFLVNQLRPVQAKQTLKLVMQVQLQKRRHETELLRRRCGEMRERVEALRVGLRGRQG